MMQLRAYGIFNGKNIYKLEAVLFRAQVSARSGRLLWPPGGAVIGHCEKDEKENENPPTASLRKAPHTPKTMDNSLLFCMTSSGAIHTQV